MAEEDLEEDDDDAGGDAGDESEAPPGGKKKLLLIIVVVILLIVGGLAGAYFTGLLDPLLAMIVRRKRSYPGGRGRRERTIGVL